ncbi:MAG: DUF885 domain-containing protein, partial [Candidatus Neomarinimicrobiota bacterium]
GPNRATGDLQALLDEDWEWTLNEYPTFASYLGDDRYNDRWTDNSLEAIARRQEYTRQTLERLLAIDRGTLSTADQLNYDLFRLEQENAIEGYTFRDELIPVNQMGGIQLGLPTRPSLTKFRHVKDYEDYLARLNGIPQVFDQTIELMRSGIKLGWVAPRTPLVSVSDQISAQVETSVDESPFYQPFTSFPDAVGAEDRERLSAAGRQAVAEVVIPAFNSFLTFFTTVYYPATRTEVGAWALPDGDEYYRYRVQVMTTTDLTPDEIHEIGLREVQRIRAEMEWVITESGFEGNFVEFVEFLRTDPQFYYTDPEELLRGYRDICKRVDPELMNLFGRLPRITYGVKPIPDFKAPVSTTAYYNGPAADGSRPGIFYANTYDLKARPKYEMEALAIHEAVPGHHLQIALAMELGELPNFRKYGGFTAFVEGWGLYSESLGEEMGFYQDPYSKFGQLTYEMWRAVRLVVDTGIHNKHWTRQQAIDYFLANTGLSELNITSEVDRYIVWPGQALAYKIGQLKIKGLRQQATAELGDQFDLRAFHDVVLGRGAVPLGILEEGVTAWIEESRAGQ